MKKSAVLVVLALVFLEWLDFSLYLYLAKAVFSKQFFPPSSYSLTLSFGLFAGAYLARPLGGWLFGRRADLFGRRNPMVYSAALMGIATLGICLLPTYGQVGLWATWGLLILRIAQGLALGGEIKTSGVFLIEHHPKCPLLMGSFVAASGALGMFVGGALASLLQYDIFSGSWRLVFAVVALVSIMICRLRKRLVESPEFHPQQGLTGAWYIYWRGLLNIAIIGAFVSVMVYQCNAFWVSFATDMGFWTKTQCAWIGSFAQLISALLAVPIAYFSKPKHAFFLIKLSMFIIALVAPCLFYFTFHLTALGALCGIGGYALANALICSSFYYFLYLQLPAHYRCRGISIVWALAASIGALSLPIAEQLTNAGVTWFPGLFVSIISITSWFLLQNSYYSTVMFKNNAFDIAFPKLGS